MDSIGAEIRAAIDSSMRQIDPASDLADRARSRAATIRKRRYVTTAFVVAFAVSAVALTGEFWHVTTGGIPPTAAQVGAVSSAHTDNASDPVQPVRASRQATDATSLLAGSRACTGADLKIAANDSAGALHDRWVWVISFTNIAITPCALPRFAGAQAIAVTQQLPLPSIQSESRPEGVVLIPGAVGATRVTSRHSCPQATTAGAAQPALTTVDLTIGTVHSTIKNLALNITCGDVRLDAPYVLQEPDLKPVSPLSVKAVFPTSAQLGGSLKYSVTLTNSSSTDYSFGKDCPVYDQGFSGTGDIPAKTESFVLDCLTRNTIPATGSVTFDFSIDLSGEKQAGYTKVGWKLDGGIGAGGVVEIK